MHLQSNMLASKQLSHFDKCLPISACFDSDCSFCIHASKMTVYLKEYERLRGINILQSDMMIMKMIVNCNKRKMQLNTPIPLKIFTDYIFWR